MVDTIDKPSAGARGVIPACPACGERTGEEIPIHLYDENAKREWCALCKVKHERNQALYAAHNTIYELKKGKEKLIGWLLGFGFILIYFIAYHL